MKHRALTIFHYHLRPGGVTSVILLGLKAIIEGSAQTGLERITVVSGGDPALEGRFKEELEKLKSPAAGRGMELSLEYSPWTGYAGADEAPEEDGAEAEKLRKELRERYSGSIWWIHNHHLGKNPRLCRAVIETARNNPDQPLFLQIHDFPENGRLPNWHLLKNRIPHPLYPLGENVFYLTINRRDREILLRAGIPPERAVQLPNPVDTAAVSSEAQPREIKRRFEQRFAPDFPGYLPGAPWGIYPVRNIRRKNILEAALGALIFPGGMNLIVTLPGTSAQEAGYSGLTEELYREGTIPGLWGTGLWRDADAPEFEELAGACDFVYSSSLQEGFGYFFIDSFRWGKPLLSREMDILEELLPLLPRENAFLYPGLLIPHEPRWSSRWKSHLASKRKELAPLIGGAILQDIEEDLRTAGEGFDFSALPPEDQAEVVRRARRDESYRSVISELNPLFTARSRELLARAGRPFPAGALDNLTEQWGFEGYSRRFSRILQSTAAPSPITPGTEKSGNEEEILRAFVNPDGLRPLFFPYPGDEI